jgi:hypothetical protein
LIKEFKVSKKTVLVLFLPALILFFLARNPPMVKAELSREEAEEMTTIFQKGRGGKARERIPLLTRQRMRQNSC